MHWLLRWLNCPLGIDARTAEQLQAIAQGWAQGGTEAPRLQVEVDERTPRRSNVVNGRAIIPLAGVLVDSAPWDGETSYEQFAFALLAALDDDECREIVIAVNSPGGLMAGAAETSDLVYRSRGRKPITAVAVYGYMASAAYLVASSADRVLATTSSFVGSIGVVMVHYDVSGALEKMGIKPTVLRRPANKYLGNEVEPLDDAALKTLYATGIDPAYQLFVERVARNRGTSQDAVRSGYGRGLALIAADAERAGLIDGVVDWFEFLGTVPGTGVPGYGIHEEGSAMKWSAKLKALLFGLGLVPAADAADDVVTVALGAWFAARSQAVPDNEQAIAAALAAPQPAAAAAPPPAAPPPPPAPPVDVAAVQAEAARVERQRQADIRARAQLLGLAGDDPTLLQAIEGGQTADAFAAAAVNAAVAANRPVHAQTTVRAGEASADRFAAAAADALLLRSSGRILQLAGSQHRGPAGRQAGEDAMRTMIRENPIIREIAGMHWRDIMATAVNSRGIRLTDRSELGLARAFLGLTGSDPHPFAHGNPRIAGSDLYGGGYDVAQGVGDYPSVLDGVAQRIVTVAIRLANVTYDRWCSRITDMGNFQPREFVALGWFGELPVHVDGKEYAQADVLPSKASWIIADEYGMEFALTPRMVLHDPTDILIQRLSDLQIAHERGVNRLCIDLLTGNVASPVDGVACYSHDNYVAAGGAPDVDQTTAMRRLINAQTLMNDTQEAGLDLDMILTGSNWLTEAQITYTQINGVTVVFNSLDEVNPYVGLQPLYDPMLSGIDSGLPWYGIANPAVFPSILYGFVSGYGPGGRRVTYYEPRTEAQVFRIKGAYGAALRHHAGLVKNAGQDLS